MSGIMKPCPECGKIKSIEEFSTHYKRARKGMVAPHYGRLGICKSCLGKAISKGRTKGKKHKDELSQIAIVKVEIDRAFGNPVMRTSRKFNNMAPRIRLCHSLAEFQKEVNTLAAGIWENIE